MKPLSDSPLYEACHGFKEERSNARFFSVLFAAFILLFAFFSWWKSAFGGVIVDGSSMKQTLYDGEKLLALFSLEAKFTADLPTRGTTVRSAWN